MVNDTWKTFPIKKSPPTIFLKEKLNCESFISFLGRYDFHPNQIGVDFFMRVEDKPHYIWGSAVLDKDWFINLKNKSEGLPLIVKVYYYQFPKSVCHNRIAKISQNRIDNLIKVCKNCGWEGVFRGNFCFQCSNPCITVL